MRWWWPRPSDAGSASRPDPDTTAKVFIAVAGLSAALPGTIAAHTTKPVIGCRERETQLDAILSVLRCRPESRSPLWPGPRENAGIPQWKSSPRGRGLVEKLKDHRDAMKKWVLEDSRTLSE